MKVLAYYALHYGSEYLEASIKSIDDHVDQILILYTQWPSYGQNTAEPCPDNRQTLYDIAHGASNKIKWVDIAKAHRENEHRQKFYQHTQGFDLVMVVDSDEVWRDADKAIKAAYATKAKNVLLNGSQWYHFWRSFDEVNRDGFAPVRFHCTNWREEEARIKEGVVYHMGYAQPERITRYKMSIHGHKDVFAEWFTDKWLDYKRGETTHLHPASNDVWIKTEDFDKTTLPDVLLNHPNYNKERI